MDDEPVVVKMASTMLANLRLPTGGVRVFSEAHQALDAFLAAPGDFDLAITDQTMPQMTGTKLARAPMNLRPDLPVILCSSVAGGPSPGEVEALGVVRRFLAKPIERQNLARCVREVLETRPWPSPPPAETNGL